MSGTHPAGRITAVVGLGVSLALCPAPALIGGEPEVRWVGGGPGGMTVELSGLDGSALSTLRGSQWSAAEWQRMLAVRVGGGPVDLLAPAMAGAYEIRSNAVVFVPAFPLQAGVEYRASFQPWGVPGAGPGGKVVGVVHRVPEGSREPVTVVEAVYPTASAVPENLLKFYLQFSGAMSRKQVYDHVRLLDDKGAPVELPFLEIDEELWDPGMTRLTLLFDPGRIKRGVKPLEDVGSALVPGRSYTLVVDAGWLDAQGRRLKGEHRKSFRVVEADRQPIDPKAWKVGSVRAGTTMALEVDFGEPLEHALARRLIQVVDSSGQALPGKWTLGHEERSGRFVPERGWPRGVAKLRISGVLEDLAGNNPGKAFDVDVFERVERHLVETFTELPITVLAPTSSSSRSATVRRRRRR